MQIGESFSEKVEKLAMNPDVSYLEAVVLVCEENEIEIEVAAKLVNTRIKQFLESEASDLNMLKEKICRLPI